MAEAVQERLTGAEEVVWDLSVFYDSLDDPKLDSDIEKLKRAGRRLSGKLARQGSAHERS